jgi:hypothetical protein
MEISVLQETYSYLSLYSDAKWMVVTTYSSVIYFHGSSDLDTLENRSEIP